MSILSSLITAPYWHDGVGAASYPSLSRLPSSIDVLVIGSGYTGLSAGLVTSRGGRSTLIVDSSSIGFGCSTRNGGQVSTSIKPSLSSLTSRYGADRARAIRSTGIDALEWLTDFVASENLDCSFDRVGRYHAAHTPSHYERLVRDSDILTSEGIDCHPVSRSSQRSELGTDYYHGGIIFPSHCSVDPLRLHREFLRLTVSSGASVVGDCAVTSIERSGSNFLVSTDLGVITARDVIIATNGYTSGLIPWLRRRVIPIGSYVIATEELPLSVMSELFPSGRIASDTRRVVYYFRPSPDGRRVIFGGRVSATETDPLVSAPRLYREMCRIFPVLCDYSVTHSWCGMVGYSFDELAHIGVHDGMYYSTSYCGSGVSMASYLGSKLGSKVLGSPDGSTAFDDLPFPSRFYYRGSPWFLGPAVTGYRLVDNLESYIAGLTTRS